MTHNMNSACLKRSKCSFEVYRSEADTFFNKKNFNAAINSYTQALEKNENDVHCLLRRSACHNALGNIESAFKDVDKVISIHPDYYKGLLQKAEVLYSMGEFEFALICFYRGYKIRPEVREFRIGIQKCEKAIQNSLDVVKLRVNKDCLSSDDKENDGLSTDRKRTTKSKSKLDDYPMHMMTSDRSKRTFGFLYDDHEYLKELMKQEGKGICRSKQAEEITHFSLDGLNYLDNRANFWFEENPSVSQASKKLTKEELLEKKKKMRSRAILRVLEQLHEIDRYQHDGEHAIAAKLAEDLRRDVSRWPEEDSAQSDEILANINTLLGLSLLELGRYDEALEAHLVAHDLGVKRSLPDVVSHALDNIGRAHAKKGNYEAAMNVWEGKLNDSKDNEEIIWLRYEIGRCLLELERSEEALHQGEQALDLAEQSGDKSWLLNINVLIGQAYLHLQRKGEAQTTFEKAQNLARSLNAVTAEKAILDVLDELQSTEREMDSEPLSITEPDTDDTLKKSTPQGTLIFKFFRRN